MTDRLPRRENRLNILLKSHLWAVDFHSKTPSSWTKWITHIQADKYWIHTRAFRLWGNDSRLKKTSTFCLPARTVCQFTEAEAAISSPTSSVTWPLFPPLDAAESRLASSSVNILNTHVNREQKYQLNVRDVRKIYFVVNNLLFSVWGLFWLNINE